jgi:hypothetical protein
MRREFESFILDDVSNAGKARLEWRTGQCVIFRSL